jgi:hypothetical protein
MLKISAAIFTSCERHRRTGETFGGQAGWVADLKVSGSLCCPGGWQESRAAPGLVHETGRFVAYIEPLFPVNVPGSFLGRKTGSQ